MSYKNMLREIAIFSAQNVLLSQLSSSIPFLCETEGLVVQQIHPLYTQYHKKLAHIRITEGATLLSLGFVIATHTATVVSDVKRRNFRIIAYQACV
jgi:hypothetical protein